ncbi:MAG TPA: SH3 domain-containing protein [Candidatus Binatia bacterium]|jgi:uncharacterized protein YgiM (DUF1202 family)|nr:SH3 domain-containing protein [Candidatus Binatia bacterium]
MSRRGLLAFCLIIVCPFSSWAIEFYQAKEGAVAKEKASAESPVIYRFKTGEEFRVTGKDGEWLQVRFSSNVTGYVLGTEAETLASHPVSSPLSAPGAPQEGAPVPASPLLDPRTRDAMEHALKPLRLLAAAMETGVNYQQYGTRLVDAKMELEGTIGDNSLNTPADFRNEVNTIFDVYQDAQLAWEWKIRQGTFCDRTDCSYSRDDSFVSALFSKYPFLRSTITQEAPGGIFLPNGIWAHSRALSLLWAEARARTEKLATTVPSLPTTATPPQAVEERLRNLKNLLDKKLITKDEYEKKRAEILKGL